MNKLLKHNLDTLNKAARIDEIEKLKAEIDKIFQDGIKEAVKK